MAVVVATGAYIPLWRLPREAVAQAWGRSSLGGERSVGNHDEDSVTMAVEAAFDCLTPETRTQIDALYFASTTAPYSEKQAASLVASAVDLPETTVTVDFANSLRCGTNALRAACDAVDAGSARSVLVVAADSRLGYPRSDHEQSFGDAAAAVVVSAAGEGAVVDRTCSVTSAMMDMWRKSDDRYVRSWEDRWVTGEGWTAHTARVLRRLLESAAISTGELSRVVLSGGNVAAQARLAKSFGLGPCVLHHSLMDTVGHAGAAHPLLGLCGALRDAPPNSRVAVVAYGDGADGLLLTVGDHGPYGGRLGPRGFVTSRRTLPSYQRYLASRDIVALAPGEPTRSIPSATVSWREEASILRCHASRCRQCGTVTFPIQRVCYVCRAKDDYDEVRLSDERGTVFTFSIDHVAGRADDPIVVQTVVEMDQTKARFYALMTDCEPKDVRIGMPVELTFRVLYEGAGFYNYFWKCRPLRVGGD